MAEMRAKRFVPAYKSRQGENTLPVVDLAESSLIYSQIMYAKPVYALQVDFFTRIQLKE
jgi:hypothetical protein